MVIIRLQIARKASLARSLNRMRRLFPDDFDFYPRTWTLPSQLDHFRSHLADTTRKEATYIVKPSSGSQVFFFYALCLNSISAPTQARTRARTWHALCSNTNRSQGSGIYLTRSAEAIAAHSNAVVQVHARSSEHVSCLFPLPRRATSPSAYTLCRNTWTRHCLSMA